MALKHLLTPVNLTVILLLIVTLSSSYFLDVLPVNLIIALLSTSVFDLFLQRISQKRLGFPSAALVSGLIIGAIAPLTAPFYVITLASFVAITTKYFLRYKGAPIFNPAAIGLIISLSAFALTDEWWGTTSFGLYGYVLSLSPILILAAYKAKKMVVGGSFFTVFVALSLLIGSVHINFTYSGIISYLFSLPYLFGFVMVSELKTSPHKKHEQVLFGAGVAGLLFLLSLAYVPYALLLSLLLGNFAYFLYRNVIAEN